MKLVWQRPVRQNVVPKISEHTNTKDNWNNVSQSVIRRRRFQLCYPQTEFSVILYMLYHIWKNSILLFYVSCFHVMCVRHHGMVRPRVADGGDRLQLWRVAENILNELWRLAIRQGVVRSLKIGRVAYKSSPQNTSLLGSVTQDFGCGGQLCTR